MALEKATATTSNQQALTPTDKDEIKQTLGVDGDLAALNQVDTDEITNNAVTNLKLANMNANTIKGRSTGNGQPQDLTPTQVRTIINVEDGAQVNPDLSLYQLKRTNITVTKTNDTYTLQASDVDKRLFIPAPCTVIVPNGLPANLEFQGKQIGVGDVEFVAQSGGTLNVCAAFQKFTEGETAYWGIVTLGGDVADLLGTLKLSV